MLMMLLLSTLLGSVDAKRFDDKDLRAVRKAVVDEERRAAVLAAMEEANLRLAALATASARSLEGLKELDTAHGSEAIEYAPFIEELWTERTSTAEDYVDLVFRMREQMTRAEWDAAFAK
jgi:hypothetical protein